MLRDYSDIIDQLGEPLWWDDNGTPRYCEFSPLLATVYDKYVAFAEIECQGCDRIFKVAAAHPIGRLYGSEWKLTELPTADSTERFHFGDPPRHPRCPGETMNCWTLRIIEFWERDDNAALYEDPWRRRPELEFVYGKGVT
jgi:hypothetical protein